MHVAQQATPVEATESRRTIGRDALVIVLTGIVLGLAFNALGLSSHPARGLSWIPAARSLDAVESVARAAVVMTPQALPGAARTTRPARSKVLRPPGGLTSAPGSAVATPEAPASAVLAADPPVRVRGFSPDLPMIPDVGRPLRAELSTVSVLVEAGAALVVDAREAEAFAEGHIAGAVNVPYDDAMREPALIRALDVRDRPVIVYCSGGTCESSRYLAELMVRDFKLRRVLDRKSVV